MRLSFLFIPIAICACTSQPPFGGANQPIACLEDAVEKNRYSNAHELSWKNCSHNTEISRISLEFSAYGDSEYVLLDREELTDDFYSSRVKTFGRYLVKILALSDGKLTDEHFEFYEVAPPIIYDSSWVEFKQAIYSYPLTDSNLIQELSVNRSMTIVPTDTANTEADLICTSIKEGEFLINGEVYLAKYYKVGDGYKQLILLRELEQEVVLHYFEHIPS